MRRLPLALALPFLAPCLALAQPPAPGPAARPAVTLTLAQALRAALARAPEVRQAEADLGPSPRARGDQVSSPDDQYSPDITGVFVRAGIEIIQPIFTWGYAYVFGLEQLAHAAGLDVEEVTRLVPPESQTPGGGTTR